MGEWVSGVGVSGGEEAAASRRAEVLADTMRGREEVGRGGEVLVRLDVA